MKIDGSRLIGVFLTLALGWVYLFNDTHTTTQVSEINSPQKLGSVGDEERAEIFRKAAVRALKQSTKTTLYWYLRHRKVTIGGNKTEVLVD